MKQGKPFCQENALVIANQLPTTQATALFARVHEQHGHHQMVNTEIKLVILFAAQDGAVPYYQKKQDQELTVALINSSFLQNSGLNRRK